MNALPAPSGRRRPSAIALLVLVPLIVATAGACGDSERPARTPSGGYVSCTSDSDCVITTSPGCCGCCPSQPRAVPKAALAKQEETCQSIECASPCSSRIDCPKIGDAASFTAICRDGTCAAVAAK